MATTNSKSIAQEVPPWLRVYDDGTIERLLGTETTPPTYPDPDPQTGVSSKDVLLSPETGVSARLYIPFLATTHPTRLPLVIYYHGGAFLVSSTADPLYQNMLNILVNQAQIILVSINYRRAPESPLPTAHDDSWEALKWVADHASGCTGPEIWIREYADFDRVFLAGDSAGANITHHMAMRAGLESSGLNLKISGILMVHPYFWGKVPIRSEGEDMVFKSAVDRWWLFVCPSEKGCDDPLINPLVDGAPSLAGLGCGKALVCVAGNDILRERGRLYSRAVMESGWAGKVELFETDGEDHVFHIIDPTTENAKMLFQRCAEFINSV